MKFLFIFFAFLFSSFLFQTSSADWIQQNSQTTYSINSVDFIDAQTGFAAGDNGVIRKTTNGGTNWYAIEFSPAASYNYIKMFSASNIIAVSYSSKKVLQSTDGGASWAANDMTGISLDIARVQFVDFNTGFACGGTTFYRSTDGGLSWIPKSPATKIRNFSMVDANTGWCNGTYNFPYPPPYGTNYAQVLRTENSGEGWQTQVNIPEQSFNIYRVFSVSSSTAMYNGFMSGSIARTTDYGSTWNAGASGCGGFTEYRYCSFSDIQNGWMLGNLILKTTNSGANWATITTPLGNPFKAIFFIDENTGWFVGTGGVILKTTTGGVTGVNTISSAVPQNYKLYQNYPNPFNPSTNIKFEISKNDFVELTVYNSIGRKVYDLVNQNLNAGTYEITFYAENLSSGIYYCRMRSGNYSETSRMILMK